jgi:hypothetical protein
MEDEERQIRDELSRGCLRNIAKERPFLFHNIDAFVALSRRERNFIVSI